MQGLPRNFMIFRLKGVSDCPDREYVVLEAVALDSPVAQFVAVGVDGVDAVVQNTGYARAFLYSEAHEGENSQVGVEALAVAQLDLFFRPQQGVYVVNECRVDVEKSVIEHLIEFAAVFFDEFSAFGEFKKIVGLACR